METANTVISRLDKDDQIIITICLPRSAETTAQKIVESSARLAIASSLHVKIYRE